MQQDDTTAVVQGTSLPLTKWANEPTVADLKDDLQMAEPSQQGQVTKIRKWMALREAAVRQDKTVANRSKVQPKLVRRQNEWRYAALSEPFLSSDKIFDVTPVSWEDAPSARQNDMLINWQFRTKMNRVAFVDEYVRTAVDEGTVIVRPGWTREVKTVEVEKPAYAFLEISSQAEMDQLQGALQIMQTDPAGFEALPAELQEAAIYTQEMQVPVRAVVSGMVLVQEEQVVRNHPTLDIVDYANCYIDPNCKGDLEKANFAIISFETSHAELLKDGRYQNLDRINWDDHSPLHEPNHQTSADISHTGFKDKARKRVVAYEYWGFYDIHGTGELVPIVATWIGQTMIRMELNPYPDQKIPLVLVRYMPIRKQVGGEPDAELLEDNQAILGALTRGMIDLLGRSANGQTGFAKGMLDAVNRRRYDQGLDYEFNPNVHPSNGVFQHTYPEIPNSALTMLQLQNQEAEALTGVKAFSGGLSGNAYGDVAAGIRGILDAASKREMAILRRLAAGMEQIGRKVLAMNAQFMSEQEVIQITNEEFVAITREAIQGEHNLKVDISTPDIDEAKAQDLGFMLQTMGASLPFEITQQILSEIARLKRMPHLARMITDFKPQPNPLEQKKQELELAKLQAEINEENARAMLAEAKAIEAQAKARALTSQADKTDLDFVEQETGTTHAREMDKHQAQAEANERLEITKAIMNPKPAPAKAT